MSECCTPGDTETEASPFSRVPSSVIVTRMRLHGQDVFTSLLLALSGTLPQVAVAQKWEFDPFGLSYANGPGWTMLPGSHIRDCNLARSSVMHAKGLHKERDPTPPPGEDLPTYCHGQQGL